MAIYNNANWPKSIIFFETGFKIVPKNKKSFDILSNNLTILPKWRNFANFDHAGGELLTKVSRWLNKRTIFRAADRSIDRSFDALQVRRGLLIVPVRRG